ncbi:transglycosylase SLT domain-containing protein [Enterobacter asburiae]|nr:transglycosylase SLT domain-containing protein [Enterobacter asburiae]
MNKNTVLLTYFLLVGCQNQYGSEEKKHENINFSINKNTNIFTRHPNEAVRRENENKLWSVIIDDLKINNPENWRINIQKKKYLKNKAHFHEVALRAEPYLYWMSREVKKRNMPMELLLLPVVESKYDPHVISRVNAAGIWQIITRTGLMYGLEQTNNYDARRDIVASTIAALDMLERLNKTFDGDWLLTIAAYNCGERRVIKAMDANKALGKPTDYWSLLLPDETMVYLPMVLALKDILKNSKGYGITLPVPDNSRALEPVHLRSPVDIQKIAGMTGISVRKLKSYNPGIKGPTLSKSGRQYIMIPQKNAEQLRASFAVGYIPD